MLSFADQKRILELRLNPVGQSFQIVAVRSYVRSIDEYYAEVDEAPSLRSCGPRRVRLDRTAAASQQVQGIGSDVSLPIGVLDNCSSGKTVPDGVEHAWIIVKGDEI